MDAEDANLLKLRNLENENLDYASITKTMLNKCKINRNPSATQSYLRRGSG